MTSNKVKSCLVCKVQEPDVLVRVDLCREPLNMLRGISPLENHHPEGRANNPETIKIPANIHAVLTAKQTQWPEDLRHPSKDPLIQIDRRLLVMQDFIEYFLRDLQRDINFLLALSLAQQEIHGQGWWTRGQVAPLNIENTDG